MIIISFTMLSNRINKKLWFSESRTRPKLALQPRTKPKEAAESASTSASIFGGAKPVDTAAREREIEERLMRNDEFPDSRYALILLIYQGCPIS